MPDHGIFLASDQPAVTFAAAELGRYLGRMTGHAFPRVAEPAVASVVLGTFPALVSLLPLPVPVPVPAVPADDPHWDDAILLKSHAGRLFLGGSNPRSVLFSVYAYLEQLGCRWLYPGPDGEVVPRADLRLDGFAAYERASLRIRGAAAYPDAPGGEHYVDWMAKSRLNYFYSEYFLEERPGGNCGNPPLTEAERAIVGWKKSMLAAARQRGLLIERYGHGWSRALLGRFAAEKGITEEEAYQHLRARRDNEAEKPPNPQHREFCLSHPDVRRILVEDITCFLDAHQHEQDVAGVWMGDGWDLACQCERCRPRPFSAWYMDIVREVATTLKVRAPLLKLECLVYMTTLLPPEGRPLDGLDNVIMMLAPMGRCYRHTLFDETCRHPDWKPDIRHNRSTDREHFRLPLNGDYLDALRGWQQCVDAPWYIFDYFNWFQTFWDRAFLAYRPQTLAEEMGQFHEHGVVGMVPCHYTQSAFPTHLVSWILAHTLWSGDADLDTLRREYLQAHFGPYAAPAEAHLDAMRAAFMRLTPHCTPLWQEDPVLVCAVAAALTALADGFDARFAPGPADPLLLRRLSWLKADTVLQSGTFRALAAHAAGDDARADAIVAELLAFLDAHRDDLTEVLHVRFARYVVKWLPDRFRQRHNWSIA